MFTTVALIQRGSSVSVSVSTNEESILQDGLAHNSDIHQNRVQSYMFLVKWTNVCAHRIGLIKYFLALSQGFNYFLTGILRMLTSLPDPAGGRPSSLKRKWHLKASFQMFLSD